MVCRARILLAIVLLTVTGFTVGCDGDARSGLDPANLEVLIDSLLPAISEASGLEVRRPVRYALQSRSEARAFITKQLDEELEEAELSGMERSYKLMGLLPETLNLRDLLLELLTEQVVGYYDPSTDRLYVVEGASAATAGPVVAHELVHALQDQHADLESLMAPERGNDRQTAAQAAAEGHAMLVMIALQAAETTGEPMDLGALPDIGPMMEPVLKAENEQFPVFQRSPRLIRETLLFPYVGGASFVQSLIRHHPGGERPVPFGGLLPQSTEQVLEPQRAFLNGRDAPTELDLGSAGEDGWSVAYSNTLGQLEAGILLSGSAGSGGASGWDGDRYALLDGPAGREALVWYSVWDDEAAADRVADALKGGDGAWSVERQTVAGRPVVRLVVTAGPGEPPHATVYPVIVGLQEVQQR